MASVWREIVGVVSNSAVDSRGSIAPKVYMPYGQAADGRNWAMTYLVKSDASVEALLPRLREALAAVDGDRVVYRPSTMEEVTRAVTASERFSVLLMSTFAAIALLITAVGIYGVLAVSVGQQTHELGIRAALGAEAGRLRAVVQKQALQLVGLGIALGVVLVLATRRWLASIVTLANLDAPWMLALVIGLLLLVGLAAGYLPARRATAVDPASALR